MAIVNYMQTDKRWANIDYSAPGEKTTIGKAGCGPTCAAMVIASWANKNITPKDTAAWSLSHGYKAKNQGTYYSYFKPQMAAYGIKAYQVNGSNLYGKTGAQAHEDVKRAIKAGHLVIACMGKGNWTSSGHFVLLYNIVDGYAYINDPNSTAPGRVKNTWALFKSQVKYYFICEKSEKQEEEDMTEERVREIVKEVLAGEGTSVPAWAKGEWQEANDRSIVVDGSRPEGYAKRDEVASMIVRAMRGN